MLAMRNIDAITGEKERVDAIRHMYATGRGRVIIRGQVAFEEIRSGRMGVVITELPYQVNKTTLIEKMADLVGSKRITDVSDIRDESDHEEAELEQIGDAQWRCDALIELEDLIEQIDWPDDADEDDVTLSGLLERELGRVPKAGDELRRGEFLVRVLTARPSRALLIGIQRVGAESE